MKVYGDGWIEQLDTRKSKYKCHKGKIRVRTECGKKCRHFVGNYSDCVKAKDAFLLELIEDNDNGSMTFEKYATKGLKGRKNNPDFSPNTIYRDTKVTENLIYRFGAYKLTEINPALLKDAIIDFKSAAGNELSGTGKNMHFSELSSILRSAVDDGYIKENPMDKVPTPKRDTKEKKCLNRKEIETLIECLDNEPLSGHVFAIFFMVYMALRSQEAFALMWEDINFKTGMLTIRRAYKRSNHSIGPTKSKAGRRTLPIPPPLLKKLKIGHSKHKEEHWDTELVCCTCTKTLMRPSTLRRGFDRFNNKYDLNHISFHELRHSNLTLIARNMNQFDLQRYAGGSSLEPAQIYIHADNESMTKSLASVFTS